jgi:hypothetical protein
MHAYMLCVLMPSPRPQKLAVEAAIKGEFVRPSERRRQQMMLESQGSGGYGNGDPAAAPYRSGSMDGRPGGYGGGRGGTYREGGGGSYRGGSGSYDRDGGYGGGERRGGYGGVLRVRLVLQT